MTSIQGPARRAGAKRARLVRSTAQLPWLGPRLAIRLHRLGLGASPVSWSELVDHVERERPEVVSVDVFDTCLVRDLLGDEPIERLIDRHRDGGIDDPAPAVEELLCRPVPDAAPALARIRAVGTSIVFLSDTERSSASLRAILARAGIFQPGDRLVASCEVGATKAGGDLYAAVWGRDPSPVDVWHVGNNLWSDVTRAEAAGLRALPMVEGEATRYEEAMAARPDTAGPALASAARKARLAIATETEPGPARDLEVLGAEVAGQAFGAFLLWLARLRAARDIGHLAFLSRDGELLLEMARAMPADHWEGATLGYLHCSRWSWLLTAAASYGLERWLEVGTADERAFIHANRHRVPLGSLLGRIGLEPADLDGHRDLAGLPADRPLPVDAVEWWVAMLADPAIGDRIMDRAEARRALIVDYLGTIGLPSCRVGLVDVGWRGRLAWAMSPIVAEVTGVEPLHVHFGGDKILNDAAASTDIVRFAYDGVSTPYPVTNPVSCVETFTASGRARVVGYERRPDGTVEPTLHREVAEVRNADRVRLWAGAVRTAAVMPSREMLDQLGCSTQPLAQEARDVLALWWTAPERFEAEAMQGLAFEADDDGRIVQPLVTPYSPRELSAGEKQPRQWRQGSAALTGQGMGPVLTMLQRLRARAARR